jgi:VIT1/CCC1 family predicted Fe2+/Mn2+ transporter
MSSPHQHEIESPPRLSSTADQPNLPEVSGTSFPLLTTVLAGFAVTIAVQLIIRPDAAADLPVRVTAAIIIFLASTLVFIASIAFAVNAQGHNYLPFIELERDSQRMLGVHEHNRWISWLQRGWESYHLAAILTFYGGIFLLLGGVNLIVWEFVGSGVAIAVFVLILANILLTVGVGLTIERRQRSTNPLRTRSHPETLSRVARTKLAPRKPTR